MAVLRVGAGLNAALVFLDLNGFLVPDPDTRLYDAMIALSSRALDKPGLARLFRDLAVPNPWLDECVSDEELDDCADDIDDLSDDCDDALTGFTDCLDENDNDCSDIESSCQGEVTEFAEQCNGEFD